MNLKILNKLIKAGETVFLIIDVQEKLVNMLKTESVKNNAVALAKAASILDVPVIITEQYPKGLGETVGEIKNALPNAIYLEKTSFSAWKDPAFKSYLNGFAGKRIVIFGIETHICVLQTALEMHDAGFSLVVVENACGSRNDIDKNSAIERLNRAGITCVTTEQVIFELLESSRHPKFKEVQALIKNL